MNFFRRIGSFLSCLMRENCEYSIKKILTYVFSTLVVYMVIFTDKEYYEILIFIGALLGIRGYERVKLWGTQEPSAPGLDDDSMLGSGKPKKSGGKRLLTD